MVYKSGTEEAKLGNSKIKSWKLPRSKKTCKNCGGIEEPEDLASANRNFRK